ncbi:hypothetical protein ACEYYA_00785 [Paracoccus sp. p3-h83]|uniref:hypothetical protein n=1 Tax=Paracoccus sp. p3-h83 TaxID=3342805 RepID=UPI0035B77ADA
MTPRKPQDDVGSDPAIGDIWAQHNDRTLRQAQLRQSLRCAQVTLIIAVVTLLVAWLIVRGGGA